MTDALILGAVLLLAYGLLAATLYVSGYRTLAITSGVVALAAGLASAVTVETVWGWLLHAEGVIHLLDDLAPHLIQQWSTLRVMIVSASAALAGGATLALAVVLPVPEAGRDVRGSARDTASAIAGGLAGSDRLRLGDYVVPRADECAGVMLTGEPGTGKTLAAGGILRACTERGSRAVIVDTDVALMPRHWRAGDLILRPDDARSVAWSPLAEMRRPEDAHMLAESLVAERTDEGADWAGYARTACAAVLQYVWRTGGGNGDLLRWLTSATIDELSGIAADTPAARLLDPAIAKTALSALQVVASDAGALRELDPDVGRDGWSLRAWIEADVRDGARLWIPYASDTGAYTMSLRRAWIDIVARSVMRLGADPERRLLLLLDELHSHGRLPILPDLVARGRKYGLISVLGYQTHPQLKAVYGEHGAAIIAGCCRTLLILRQQEPDTSELLSRRIGDIERVREQRGHSDSTGGAGGLSGAGGQSSDSVTWVTETVRAVLPAEIAGLADRDGYVRHPRGYTQITIPLPDGDESADAVPYVPRERGDAPAAAADDEVDEVFDFRAVVSKPGAEQESAS